ncbi:MAG: winged helix-turn-helix transcriptional regulator [Tidjanibacter sp.]|nr:winged helix-turn-helix transcriptional regulator [Tidjanibacter sp.]
MGKVNIDKIDKKILQFLVKNARMPFLEIARECGISGAAIHQRVKKLTDQGIIKGSSLEVDPKSLGYDVCAIVGIQVTEPVMGPTIAEALKSIKEVVECHYVTGKNHLMIKMYCLDNDHLMRALNDMLKIPGVGNTETLISLSQPFSRQIDVSHLSDE